MASVQIGLGQTNPHRQSGCSVQPFALIPRGGERIPALMNSVFVRSRGGQHTGSKCAQDQKGGLHLVRLWLSHKSSLYSTCLGPMELIKLRNEKREGPPALYTEYMA